MEGACSVVRLLLEEGGGTATNVGNISKRAGKIIRKGVKKGLMMTLDREKK